MKKVILLVAFTLPIFLSSCGNGHQTDNSGINSSSSMDPLSEADTTSTGATAPLDTVSDDVP